MGLSFFLFFCVFYFTFSRFMLNYLHNRGTQLSDSKNGEKNENRNHIKKPLVRRVRN